MNYETTSILLEAIRPYLENATVEISTENKDWRGHSYESDLVSIDPVNHVGFEVFENEIIVSFFTDHCHFKNQISELQNGEENYIERAKSFLIELFEHKIQLMECWKGKKLSSEKYYLLCNDGSRKGIGRTWFGLVRFINPFGKKFVRSTTWQFDKAKGIFTTRTPKMPDSDAVKVIDISEDCYIEIFHAYNVYTYKIMETEFDDFLGVYYWTYAANVCQTGMYDTEEKAISEAMEALKCRAGIQSAWEE